MPLLAGWWSSPRRARANGCRSGQDGQVQPHRAHRYWHVIVCCGALVLVAGCGSPDSGSSSTPSPVSTSASTLADSTAPTQPAPGSATQATETPDLGDRCGTPLPASTPLWMGSGPDRLYGVAAGRGALGVVLIHGSGRRGLCTWAAESSGWPMRTGSGPPSMRLPPCPRTCRPPERATRNSCSMTWTTGRPKSDLRSWVS